MANFYLFTGLINTDNKIMIVVSRMDANEIVIIEGLKNSKIKSHKFVVENLQCEKPYKYELVYILENGKTIAISSGSFIIPTH